MYKVNDDITLRLCSKGERSVMRVRVVFDNKAREVVHEALPFLIGAGATDVKIFDSMYSGFKVVELRFRHTDEVDPHRILAIAGLQYAARRIRLC